MRKALAFTLALFAASLMTAAVSLGRQDDRPRISNGPKIKALVFHKTTGYRHASIPYAIEQLKAYGDANGMSRALSGFAPADKAAPGERRRRKLTHAGERDGVAPQAGEATAVPAPSVDCTKPEAPAPAPPAPPVVPPAPAPGAPAPNPPTPPPGVFCTTPALTPRNTPPAFVRRMSVSAIGRL